MGLTIHVSRDIVLLRLNHKNMQRVMLHRGEMAACSNENEYHTFVFCSGVFCQFQRFFSVASSISVIKKKNKIGDIITGSEFWNNLTTASSNVNVIL